MKGKEGKRDRSVLGSLKKAVKGFMATLPLLAGVVLLVGLFRAFITEGMLGKLFTGNMLSDTVLGAAIGSVSAGNPITSYVIGGMLRTQGVTMFAVTAFIVTWVTVGIVQLPAEAGILGRKFALARNAISFVLSLVVAIITVLITGVT